MESKENKNLLTIKVLRLLRPSLIGPLPLVCDSRDIPGELWGRELAQDVTSTSDLPFLSLGQFLRLPQGFGNMYLGETFSSYICIHNESQIKVTNISAKIELQTNTQKFVLADRKNHPEMDPNSTMDIVMNHEIKEMGKHMLICNLAYSVNTSPEPVFLERYFKFQVKKPLDVKTKLYNSETEEVFLEAQVQNLTGGPIFMEKVDLEPSQHFTCTALRNSKDKDPKDFNNRLLDVESSQQFLYRLKPKSQAKTAVSANNIGKLDIVWRSTMGEKGRLQTSQLQRQSPIWQDLRIQIEVDTSDDNFHLFQPFKCICKLTNTTNDQMNILLELDDRSNENFTWIGLTKTNLGVLEPSDCLTRELVIFPLKTGLISITGIKVTDLKKGGKFLFNDLVQVFVMSNPNPEE